MPHWNTRGLGLDHSLRRARERRANESTTPDVDELRRADVIPIAVDR